MAFPTVINTGLTSATGTNSSTNSITMPASIVAGRLLLAEVFSSNTSTLTPSAGWSSVGTNIFFSSTFRLSVFAAVAAGSDTLTVTFGGAGQTAAITYQVDAWSGVISDVKYVFLDATLDPPSLTMGSNADNLWLAGAFNFGSLTAPTNYSNLITQTYPGGGVLATAQRALTAVTEDPGAFGGSPLAHCAYTVGVAPAGGGGGPTPTPAQPIVMPGAAAHQSASW